MPNSITVLVRDLSYVNFDIKYLLMKTYCMSIYGSPLWELVSNCIDRFYVAWCKGIRRLLVLPYNTHCELLNLICDDLPIDNQIDSRTCKFFA